MTLDSFIQLSISRQVNCRTLEAGRIRARDVSAYLGECLLFLLLLPLHLRNLAVRQREGRYQGVFWHRLFGGSPGVTGSILFIASGIGETRQADVLAARFSGHVRILSQLSKSFADLKDVSGNSAYAPFKWPIGALLALRRQRPAKLVFVGNVSDVHLAFWARMMRIPVAVIHTSLSVEEAQRRRKFLARLRFRLADLFAVRSEEQVHILRQLGVPHDAVHVVGPQLRLGLISDRKAIRDQWMRVLDFTDRDLVIVAGSTHPEDERIVIHAAQLLWQTHPNVKIIIAPRRLDREGGHLSVLQETGVHFALRSKGPCADSRVVVLDTIGELSEVYSIANLVFVGGTFDSRIGGHSFAEALEWDVWFTSGPALEHQLAITHELQRRDLLEVCRDSEELSRAWRLQLEKAPVINLTDQSIEKIKTLITG